MAAPEGTYSRQDMVLPFASGEGPDDGLLLTERLCLRRPTLTDVDRILAMDSDRVVMEHFPEKYQVHDAEEYRQKLVDGMDGDRFDFFYAVNLREAPDELFGWLILRPTEDGRWIETGWRFMKEFWGKGYAPEGAKACLDLAFNVWKVPEVMALISSENTNSARVAEKLGMAREGTYFEHDEELDLWVARR